MTAHPELLVSLAALPGLDATGLRLLSSVSGGEYVCIGYRPRVRAWYALPVMSDARTAEECEWVPLGLDARIDLADSATRDRVARWCGERRKLEAGCTAPHWHHDFGGRCALSAVTRWTTYCDAVDAYDDTKLEDGSRKADAHALAMVAVHLGQTVTP
jgi:hypothetical protein